MNRAVDKSGSSLELEAFLHVRNVQELKCFRTRTKKVQNHTEKGSGDPIIQNQIKDYRKRRGRGLGFSSEVQLCVRSKTRTRTGSESSQLQQQPLLLSLQLLHALPVLVQPVLQPLQQRAAHRRHLAAQVLGEHRAVVDLGDRVQVGQAVDLAVRVLLLLTQDPRQLHGGLQAHLPDGVPRNDVHRDLHPLVLGALLRLRGLEAGVQNPTRLGVLVLDEAGEDEAHEALVQHLVHGLGPHVHVGRPHGDVRVGVVPANHPHRLSGGVRQPLRLGGGGGQLLRGDLHPVLPLVRAAEDDDGVDVDDPGHLHLPDAQPHHLLLLRAQRVVHAHQEGVGLQVDCAHGHGSDPRSSSDSGEDGNKQHSFTSVFLLLLLWF
uniref:Uncharacterized protein n=1 Tax=Nothobranchius furzeri TaxID=105023 RepID=A0A1A8VLM1_NOTFU